MGKHDQGCLRTSMDSKGPLSSARDTYQRKDNKGCIITVEGQNIYHSQYGGIYY